MNKETLALGKAYVKPAVAKATSRISSDERLALVEKQIEDLMKIVMILRSKSKRVMLPDEVEIAVPEQIQAPHGLNKDGIPNELVCIGETEKQQFPLCMTVKPEYYQVGLTQYPSVSAAAEAVSGVRRSGWAFWKLPDGRTLKEVFKK
jgi:hypothetical protein